MSKKEIIIEKARNLFKQYGYKKVSMDQIAMEANVTKKTIYSYFKDKDELFKFFIEEELTEMKNLFEEDQHKTFIESFSFSIYSALKFRRNSDLFSNLAKNNQDLKLNKFLELYDSEIISYIENKIKEGIDKKQIKQCDNHLVAFIIYKVFISVMFEYDKQLDEDKVTKEITSILKDGLLN